MGLWAVPWAWFLGEAHCTLRRHPTTTDRHTPSDHCAVVCGAVVCFEVRCGAVWCGAGSLCSPVRRGVGGEEFPGLEVSLEASLEAWLEVFCLEVLMSLLLSTSYQYLIRSHERCVVPYCIVLGVVWHRAYRAT